MARIITAVEISEFGIQAVEVAAQHKKLTILRFLEKPIREEELSPDKLSLFFSEHNLHREEVITSVPGEMLITRRISIPFQEKSKIDKTLPYEVEPLVPFPVADLELGYQILDQQGKSSDILVYALPRSLLDQRTALFESAGIPLRMITVSSLAAVNSLFQAQPDLRQGSFTHLHIAARFSILSIYEKGILNHLQRLGFHVDSLYQTLLRKTGLDSIARLDEIPEAPSSGSGSILPILQEGASELVRQIKKGLQAYRLHTQRAPSGFLLVTGTVPGIRLFPPLLEAELSMQSLVPDSLPPFSHSLQNPGKVQRLHAPLGGILMQWGRDSVNGVFRKKKHSLLSRIRESRRELRYAAIILVILCIGSFADFVAGIQAKEFRYLAIRKEMRKIFTETFPNVKNVVNELAQMKLQMKDIEKQNDIFRNVFGEKPSPLEILNELSVRIPDKTELRITDFTLDEKSVRFIGWTDSFNSVNRIEQQLKASDLLGTVKVSNAKVGKNKSQVNFQMTMTFRK